MFSQFFLKPVLGSGRLILLIILSLISLNSFLLNSSSRSEKGVPEREESLQEEEQWEFRLPSEEEVDRNQYRVAMELHDDLVRELEDDGELAPDYAVIMLNQIDDAIHDLQKFIGRRAVEIKQPNPASRRLNDRIAELISNFRIMRAQLVEKMEEILKSTLETLLAEENLVKSELQSLLESAKFLSPRVVTQKLEILDIRGLFERINHFADICKKEFPNSLREVLLPAIQMKGELREIVKSISSILATTGGAQEGGRRRASSSATGTEVRALRRRRQPSAIGRHIEDFPAEFSHLRMTMKELEGSTTRTSPRFRRVLEAAAFKLQELYAWVNRRAASGQMKESSSTDYLHKLRAFAHELSEFYVDSITQQYLPLSDRMHALWTRLSITSKSPLGYQEACAQDAAAEILSEAEQLSEEAEDLRVRAVEAMRIFGSHPSSQGSGSSSVEPFGVSVLSGDAKTFLEMIGGFLRETEGGVKRVGGIKKRVNRLINEAKKCKSSSKRSADLSKQIGLQRLTELGLSITHIVSKGLGRHNIEPLAHIYEEIGELIQAHSFSNDWFVETSALGLRYFIERIWKVAHSPVEGKFISHQYCSTKVPIKVATSTKLLGEVEDEMQLLLSKVHQPQISPANQLSMLGTINERWNQLNENIAEGLNLLRYCKNERRLAESVKDQVVDLVRLDSLRKQLGVDTAVELAKFLGSVPEPSVSETTEPSVELAVELGKDPWQVPGPSEGTEISESTPPEPSSSSVQPQGESPLVGDYNQASRRLSNAQNRWELGGAIKEIEELGQKVSVNPLEGTTLMFKNVKSLHKLASFLLDTYHPELAVKTMGRKVRRLIEGGQLAMREAEELMKVAWPKLLTLASTIGDISRLVRLAANIQKRLSNSYMTMSKYVWDVDMILHSTLVKIIIRVGETFNRLNVFYDELARQANILLKMRE